MIDPTSTRNDALYLAGHIANFLNSMEEDPALVFDAAEIALNAIRADRSFASRAKRAESYRLHLAAMDEIEQRTA